MELSMTAMSNLFAEDKVSKKMILQALIDCGYLTDIKTITPEGFKAGITYKYGKGGSKWPVYDESIQERIRNSLPQIKERYASLYEEPKPIIIQPRKKHRDIRFPYLGIDDNCVIIDTETTGLSETDEIIELAIVDLDKNTLYHSFFYPDVEVNPGAAKVNHLSRELLKDNPTFSEEWETIKNVIGSHRLIGHNIPFDKRLVLQTLSKTVDNAEEEVEKLFNKMIDTKPLAKEWIKSKSYSLNNLTTLIGITREEQHNAADDCRMTIEFLERLEDVITIRAEYDFIKVDAIATVSDFEEPAETTTYRPFNDGWFTYHICEKCGNKSFSVPDICPSCQRRVEK